MFQTRRHSGEIREFQTFTEASEDAKDPEVWKISWEIQPGVRIRLVRLEVSPEISLYPFTATVVVDHGVYYVGTPHAAP